MQEYESDWISDQVRECKTILELGYGAGVITRDLVRYQHIVYTVDGSKDLAAKASKDGAFGSHSMFEDLEFNDKLFHCVIASFVLEHVVDPVALLKRCREWSDKLIVVVGNANSYHRQLAVQMGLQPKLNSLSARDEQVGHYRVYDWPAIVAELHMAAWTPIEWKGLQFKPLPNSMMAGFSPELIRAMCEIDVPFECAANLLIVCK